MADEPVIDPYSRRGLNLPKLERDPFNWTEAELATAVAEMRSKLFVGVWERAA